MYHLDEKEINTEFDIEPFDSAAWYFAETSYKMDLENRLKTALEDENRDEIEIIFESLTHQMSFYSATYIVLPHMVRLLEQMIEKGDFVYGANLILNLGVCLATDIFENNFKETNIHIIENYNAAVQKLVGLTKRYINMYIDEIHKMNEEQKHMLFTGVLSILGERKAVFVLMILGWNIEEIGLMCDKECGYLEEYFVPFDNNIIIPTKYGVEKWDGKSYDDAFVWSSAIADMLEDKYAVEVLKYLYGDFTCPKCGKTKKVIDFVIPYFT